MKARRISRRTLLRGLGAAIALPWLEAMSSKSAYSPASPINPLRLACLYFPNGVWMRSWIPKTAGQDYELPYSLQPLEKFKHDIAVISGLDKAQSKQGDGHFAKTGNFLTGLKVTKTTGKNIGVGGISVDQLAAEKIGSRTALRSLELGIDPVASGIDTDTGYTKLYGSHISWRNATTPVAREINPHVVYQRICGDASSEMTRITSSRNFISLLDMVLEDAKGLRKSVGRDDQVKLDEYLDSVRDLESRVEFYHKMKRQNAQRKLAESSQIMPDTTPLDYREHVKLMLDLMVLAFQSDATRILTFMFANDVSGREFSFLPGVSGGHHDISHHQSNGEKVNSYKQINRWHCEQFAYLLERMSAIREGDGSLLDNCAILFGSSISDGMIHSPLNLPIILAGSCGGAFKMGRHIACKPQTPLCNLYLTLLRAMAVPAGKFGDSTGPITELY